MCYKCQNGKEKHEKSDKRAVTSQKLSYKHASKLTQVSAIASLQKKIFQSRQGHVTPKRLFFQWNLREATLSLGNLP
jgi:hypothetical protein